jgi:hypothetical protein
MVPLDIQDFIKKSLWSSPSDIAKHVKSMNGGKEIKTYQIRYLWQQLCQSEWRLCDDQVESARRLLDQHKDKVKMFDMQEIPGVTALAFGILGVGTKLRDVVEVAMDATCTKNFMSHSILLTL